MQIQNSNINDLKKIFELYRIATAYMRSKNQVFWPEFPKSFIEQEIREQRQWKILIEDEIACIWATTQNDELIWGKENNPPSVYIHRIATNPVFRGQNLVKHLVNWAEEYCKKNNLKYIRMDTVGYNKSLIDHYGKFGFDFLGIEKLESANGLPDHYNMGDVCFFQKEINNTI